MGDERCRTCRYWKPSATVEGVNRDAGLPVAEGDAGYCRRHPPAPIVPKRTAAGPWCHLLLRAWRHPVTSGGDWCGEYRPKGAE